jgi:hypothetical protein
MLSILNIYNNNRRVLRLMEILAVEINYYSAPSSRGIDHFFVGFKNMIVVLYLFKLHFKINFKISDFYFMDDFTPINVGVV